MGQQLVRPQTVDKDELFSQLDDSDSDLKDDSQFKNDQNSKLAQNLDMSHHAKQRFTLGYFFILKQVYYRLPWLIEDKLGINMNYHCAQYVPEFLVESQERQLVKGNDLEEIKKLIFKGTFFETRTLEYI